MPSKQPAVLLPPDVHRQLKIFSVIQGREMREVAATAILEYLARQAQPKKEKAIAL